jgi:hypothetical protein
MKNIDERGAGNLRFDDEGIANLLLEIANMRHPQLKLLPLELNDIKTYFEDRDSTVMEGALGEMHSITVSAIFGNGEIRKSVAISLLISAVKIYDTTDRII